MHMASQSWVGTALHDVPLKLFTFRFHLIRLKNSPTCQPDLWMSAMVFADSLKRVVRKK